LEAHQKGMLHRALSVFVFNENNELMLHRRALHKYHSPGLWTNTCCSHPRKNELPIDAAHRRLVEEMGFDCALEPLCTFIYKSEFDNGLIEHELDHVFIGHYNGSPTPNPEEVAEYKYISLDHVKQEVQTSPDNYTVWFKIILDRVASYIHP